MTKKAHVVIGYESHDGQEWISRALVAPETVSPPLGTEVYIIGLNSVFPDLWGAPACRYEWLAEGRVFLAEDDAQAMSNWLTVCRTGGAG